MNKAYNTEDYEITKRLLDNIIRRLEKYCPQAARSLREGLEETLTMHRIKAQEDIRKILATTNPIENLNGRIRDITRRVKQWKNSDMVIC